MAYICPKDSTHQSEDADYCSVCGTKINAAPLSASAPGPARAILNGATSTEVCPDCGLARNAGARFCEVCRYDFEAHASAQPSAPLATPVLAAPALSPPIAASLPPAAVTPAPLPVASVLSSWQAIVAVDPSLYADPDPAKPCPVGEPERVFPLDLNENLIGRRSDRRDIHPEVPLTDTGVSHRHAKLLKQADGSLMLLELGSTNGTELNGKEVPAGVPTPVSDGDQITLGCWTRITVQAV